MSQIVVPTQPIESSANWKSAAIVKRAAEWFLQLGDADVAEIDAAHKAGAVRGGFPSKIPGKIVFETSEKWENEMTATH